MSPKRRALCAAAVIATAVAVWSWLRPSAPLAAGEADVMPPAAAIDPARRAAAVALAREPNDDPWVYAQRVAASSPEDAKPTCGMGEEPAFGEVRWDDAKPSAELTRPAGAADVSALRRIDQALRASADPFDRAVADVVAPALLAAPRIGALVRAAIDSGDPRLYALADGACRTEAPPQAACQQLDARQWASIDPGNGVPWLYLFKQASAADDASGQEEALAHLAASARFEQRFFGMPAAVAQVLPDDDDAIAAKLALVMRATALASAATPPFGSLETACRDQAGGDANRVQQCQAISDVLFDHSDTLMGRAVGGSLFKLATGDSSRLDVAHAEQAVFNAHWSPATGFSPCGEARDRLKSVLRSATLGELEAARERSRTFVTP
jgi:hypothetical protein